jgi:hypothetical protein
MYDDLETTVAESTADAISDISRHDDVLKRRQLKRDEDFLEQHGGAAMPTMPRDEPERAFRKRTVSGTQMDLAFAIHFRNPFAAAARNRVLSEFRNGELQMERDNKQVFPNDSWMHLWCCYYKQFLGDWYDWYKCVGIVPLRIVEIAPGVKVPRVPKGKCRILTYVNPLSDVQCFEYWRFLEDGERKRIETATSSGEQVSDSAGTYGHWYFDPEVVFHANIGANPDPITGDLRSSVGTIVNEVIFAQSLQLLQLRQLAENSSRRPWIENTAPYKPKNRNMEGISYAYYSRSDDPDLDSQMTEGKEDLLGEDGTRALTSAERQAQEQLDLLDIYEDKWRQFSEGKPPSSGRSTVAMASAVLDSMNQRVANEPPPRPLPPQTKIVQRQAYPLNTGFVEQVKLSQEQIAVAYGLSRDALSSGEALRGNTEATLRSFDEHMLALWGLVSDILTPIFNYIHMDYEVESTLNSIANEYGGTFDNVNDVFSVAQRHYEKSRITLRMSGPCRVESGEELTSLYHQGVIDWDSYVTMQRNRFNITGMTTTTPKEFLSTSERKELLLGPPKEKTATSKSK